MWGGMASCGGLVIRPVLDTEFTYGPITNRPQIDNPMPLVAASRPSGRLDSLESESAG
jgi:hypothetical protein